MTTPKVKSSDFQSFLDTTPLTTPTWSRMGDGITTAKINMNPKTTDETYIHEETGSTSIDSYMPNMPVEMTAKKTDPVFEFVFDLYQSRAVLGDAEADILHVYLFQTAYNGWYPAEKQTVAISIEDVSREGGVPVKINYTAHYNGSAVRGWYNVADGVFIATADIVTSLATLVIGSLTLTPTFASGTLTYTAPSAVTPVSVTATATDPDASIVILNGATPVTNGGNAALVLGANVLTITCNVGDVNTAYTVTVTKS